MAAAASVAAAGLALAALPGAASSARRSCVPRGAHVELATASAVVYGRLGRDGLNHSYGCLLSAGRSFALARHDDVNGDTVAVPKALAGRYAGFAVTTCAGPGGEDCVSAVRVIDLRDGRRVRSAKAFRGTSNDFFVDDLVLAGSGDVAWIAESDDPQHPSAHELRAATARTGSRLLDTGADVAEHSLARAGERVYWTRGGQPRSALLR